MQKAGVNTKGGPVPSCFGTRQVAIPAMAGRKVLGVLAMALLSLSGVALAQIDNLQLTGVAPVNRSLGGFYTSPYQVSINGSATSTPVICDDFSTEVSIGLTWNASETNLQTLATATAPLTTLKFDQSSLSLQLTNYEVAAYLAKELITYQPNSFTDLAAEELSDAIWQVFDYNDVVDYIDHNLSWSEVQAIESDYNTAVSDANADSLTNVFAFTPNPLSASQEYLSVVTPLNAVPEPATALFGFALMGAVATARRPRRIAIV